MAVRDHLSEVAAVLVNPEDLAQLEETLSVLADPQALADIREADAAYTRGRLWPFGSSKYAPRPLSGWLISAACRRADRRSRRSPRKVAAASHEPPGQTPLGHDTHRR